MYMMTISSLALRMEGTQCQRLTILNTYNRTHKISTYFYIFYFKSIPVSCYVFFRKESFHGTIPICSHDYLMHVRKNEKVTVDVVVHICVHLFYFILTRTR